MQHASAERPAGCSCESLQANKPRTLEGSTFGASGSDAGTVGGGGEAGAGEAGGGEAGGGGGPTGNAEGGPTAGGGGGGPVAFVSGSQTGGPGGWAGMAIALSTTHLSQLTPSLPKQAGRLLLRNRGGTSGAMCSTGQESLLPQVQDTCKHNCARHFEAGKSPAQCLREHWHLTIIRTLSTSPVQQLASAQANQRASRPQIILQMSTARSMA